MIKNSFLAAIAAAIKLDSDPICSSAGCTQFAHKVTPLGYDLDYPVPSHGPDPDMVATQRSIEIGEAAHAHKLIMGTAESQAKWHNVAKDTPYNFAPDLDEDMTHTAKHLTGEVAVQTDVSAFLEQNLLLRRQVRDLQEMVKALQQEATDAQVEVRLRKSQCARVSKQLRRLKEQHEAAD